MFMNSETSMTSDPYRSLLKQTWREVSNISQNNKFRISVPTWNVKFELLDGYKMFNIISNIFLKNMKHFLMMFQLKYIKTKLLNN